MSDLAKWLATHWAIAKPLFSSFSWSLLSMSQTSPNQTNHSCGTRIRLSLLAFYFWSLMLESKRIEDFVSRPFSSWISCLLEAFCQDPRVNLSEHWEIRERQSFKAWFRCKPRLLWSALALFGLGNWLKGCSAERLTSFVGRRGGFSAMRWVQRRPFLVNLIGTYWLQGNLLRRLIRHSAKYRLGDTKHHPGT